MSCVRASYYLKSHAGISGKRKTKIVGPDRLQVYYALPAMQKVGFMLILLASYLPVIWAASGHELQKEVFKFSGKAAY